MWILQKKTWRMESDIKKVENLPIPQFEFKFYLIVFYF